MVSWANGEELHNDVYKTPFYDVNETSFYCVYSSTSVPKQSNWFGYDMRLLSCTSARQMHVHVPCVLAIDLALVVKGDARAFLTMSSASATFAFAIRVAIGVRIRVKTGSIAQVVAMEVRDTVFIVIVICSVLIWNTHAEWSVRIIVGFITLQLQQIINALIDRLAHITARAEGAITASSRSASPRVSTFRRA